MLIYKIKAMKRSVIFTLSMLSSILCSISLFAQTGSGSAVQLDGYDFSTFTINGFEVAGPEYTEQDIIRVFGQPDTVLYEFGRTYMYERKIKILNKEVGTGDYYIQITLPGSSGPIIGAFAADTSSVMNGYIRVGDPVLKVYDMGGRFKDNKSNFKGDGSGYIWWCPSGWGNADWIVCPEISYDNDGKITSFGIWTL